MSSTSRRDIEGALKATSYLQAYLKEQKERLPVNDNNLQTSYKKLNEEFKSLSIQKQQFEQQLEEKTNEINKLFQKVDKMKELEKINCDLKEQASKYQSALGTATNFRMSDNDKNNSVQLKDDILRLQDDLESYVTSLRPKVELNLKNVNTLLNKYKSKAKFNTQSFDIPIIKAVLQRHVLETIFSYVKSYTNNVGDDYNDDPFCERLASYALEAQIGFKTNELISLMDKFVKNREGDDNTASTVPIKIRQQVYSALGNRGFSNIINGQKKGEHGVIRRFKSDLNVEMERHRKLLDPKKKEMIEEKAASIILGVIRIFYFRVRTQEPMVQMHWYQSKDKVDPSVMIGMWDDDKIDNIEVDICKFPLIGIDLYNDLNRQIYTHAIIHHREITNVEVSKSNKKNEKNERNEKNGKNDSGGFRNPFKKGTSK